MGRRRWQVAAGTVLITVAACSSGASSPMSPSQPAQPGNPELSTTTGKALTISRGPAVGRHQRSDTGRVRQARARQHRTQRRRGDDLHPPDAGFTGTDQLPVTVSHTVMLYTEPAAADRSTASPTVDPMSKGGPLTKRCFRHPIFTRRSPISNSPTAWRRWSKPSR